MRYLRPATKLALITMISGLALSGCKVETTGDGDADGDGKKGVNIHVEPMDRNEIKNAANKAIDTTAEAADNVKNAAKAVVPNVTVDGKTILRRETTDSAAGTGIPAGTVAEPSPVVEPTPADVVTPAVTPQ